MDIEEAKKILTDIGVTITDTKVKKGSKERSCIDCFVRDRFAYIEGYFTADELEALVCLMKQGKRT